MISRTDSEIEAFFEELFRYEGYPAQVVIHRYRQEYFCIEVDEWLCYVNVNHTAKIAQFFGTVEVRVYGNNETNTCIRVEIEDGPPLELTDD